MYPADQFGIGFTEADLPDSIEVFDQFNTYTYTKNGSIYEFGNQSLRAVDGRWAPFLDEDELGDRSQPCLIAPNDTLRVTDFFSDTYTVLYTENESIPSVEVTVIRQSLCVWTSEEFEYNESLRALSLEYSSNSLYGVENQNKWIIQNSFLLWVKNPYQNGPVGSYSSPSISTISVQ
jgi:hypothetical protein